MEDCGSTFQKGYVADPGIPGVSPSDGEAIAKLCKFHVLGEDGGVCLYAAQVDSLCLSSLLDGRPQVRW